jgi:hypothetical protein
VEFSTMMSRLFEQSVNNPESALNIWADAKFAVLLERMTEQIDALKAELRALRGDSAPDFV